MPTTREASTPSRSATRRAESTESPVVNNLQLLNKCTVPRDFRQPDQLGPISLTPGLGYPVHRACAHHDKPLACSCLSYCLAHSSLHKRPQPRSCPRPWRPLMPSARRRLPNEAIRRKQLDASPKLWRLTRRPRVSLRKTQPLSRAVPLCVPSSSAATSKPPNATPWGATWIQPRKKWV